MKRFEYKNIWKSYRMTEKELNIFGLDRWELVSVLKVSLDFYYYFKRELPEDKENK